MNISIQVNSEELVETLLYVAPVRPVMIWGPPGIGKTAVVNQFSELVGLPCVSLLGSQLAPEDIIGIPQIKDDKSVFVTPKLIKREEPYVLFLDELNACSQEVQKAFYSLILEHRIGEYIMPEGSIIIAAGNRAQDSAIVKTMSSALINRMFHVELKIRAQNWLKWAYENDLHPWVIDYISQRPDHLFSVPPKTEETFSTPRSWHMLSDVLKECDTEKLTEDKLKLLAYGCLTPRHAGMFVAFTKKMENKYLLQSIIKGKEKWPADPKDRDVLYFLAQSFRDYLLMELPKTKQKLNNETQYLVHRSKQLIKELVSINYEYGQMIVARDGEKMLPDWYMTEIVRDLPRLVTGE